MNLTDSQTGELSYDDEASRGQNANPIGVGLHESSAVGHGDMGND